jgi:hypothetical protein
MVHFSNPQDGVGSSLRKRRQWQYSRWRDLPEAGRPGQLSPLRHDCFQGRSRSDQSREIYCGETLPADSRPSSVAARARRGRRDSGITDDLRSFPQLPLSPAR